MVHTCMGLVAFHGTIGLVLAFIGPSDGFLIAGSILIGSALIALAIHSRPAR